ncbi:AbrB/MazE/SpoVT family DNA-binding domain-containing protein [Thermogymnomonas acidicola]|uniref:AbrB/MazE/SpoVT family DNA-binding domain-containing protein n=1 Tax=Thermogymnomonas acidicola TaxID=399579 RepID=UPI0013969DA6|nr:AbrB/MazE/SpoVT family DNA-binding domain-containing protein [Thermogymnomonas acidicola]
MSHPKGARRTSHRIGDCKEERRELQVTVPVNARKVLGLESGDILGFFWDGERIVLRKVS